MSRTSRTALVLIALGATLSACGPPDLHPYEHYLPFGYEDWFRDVVEKVAMVPVFMKPDGRIAADSEREVRLVGSSIAARLKRSGIKTLRYTAWTTCWAEGVPRYPGLLDAKTGQTEKELRKRLFADCASALGKRSGIDAVVEPQLKIVSAAVAAGQVRWHGVEQDLRSPGQLSSASGDGGVTAPAISLFVRVFDLEGELVFENAGGVEVAPKLESRDRLATRDDILTDEGKVRRAVEIAFEPLLGATSPGAER
jgi:hypothetical protein